MRVRPNTVLLLVSLLLLLVAAAYIQWGTFGLPTVSSSLTSMLERAEPYGFPAWLRITHYVNLLFLVLLIRSGLQILMDHPRLYGNVHCTPGTEWLRLTPIQVPKDRVWTAKDDSRPLSAWIGLPGHRHTVGMARHWHFLSVLFWVGNGVAFVALLFGTGQWRRLDRPASRLARMRPRAERRTCLAPSRTAAVSRRSPGRHRPRTGASASPTSTSAPTAISVTFEASKMPSQSL